MNLLKKILIALMLVIVLVSSSWAKAVSYEDIVTKARDLASKSYKEPKQIPTFLRDLSYDQYQNIRFNPEKSLWHEANSNFQVMLVPPGLFYNHAVKINVVDAQKSQTLPFDRSLFEFADEELGKRIPTDLGYAGLKLTYPLQQPDERNQFLVFAGASYFRGVGKDNAWGISARGLAIDTGLPGGEEFPSFVEFWVLRPSADAQEILVFALLDGPSVSGAYQFTVRPSTNLTVKVKATLFARKKINLTGVAPLTSMFFYGENTGRPRGEWRNQVHDSDGLLIHNGVSGEWLWRPLINPINLEMDYFSTENVRGFGLMQRDNSFKEYQDMGAHYQSRPSTWVTPEGNWGNGKVVLVQLPTDMETNDNIVAFWSPDAPIEASKPLTLSYTLRFGKKDLAAQTMGHTINTFVGDGNLVGGGSVKGAYRVIVDFQGGELDKVSNRAQLTAAVSGQEGTDILESYVEYSELLKAWRLSVLAKPAKNRDLVLRAYLKEEEQALTETWNYRLPSTNDISVDKE